MFVCKDCGISFTEPNEAREPYVVDFMYWYLSGVCPYCDSESIVEIAEEDR